MYIKKYRFIISVSSIFIIIMIDSCSRQNSADFYESKYSKKNVVLKKTNEFTITSRGDSITSIGKLRFTFATNPSGSLHAFYDELKRQFIITNRELCRTP